MYFDTHVHLNSEPLYDDYEKFVQKALDHNVTYMVVVGYDLASSKRAVDLASKYSFLYAAVAIGPNDCLTTTRDDMESINQYLKNPKVVAIGETGLDYYWDTVSKEKQWEVFNWHMELAKEYNKPVVIHCRDAYEDTYKMLQQHKHYGIMHCYSGSLEMAKRYVDLGFYISLAGPVTFKNAKAPKDVATNIALENLLIETDCPYLAPQPFRGKLNEPANVIYIAQEIAKLKNMEIENVARATTFNAKEVFGIK